MTFPTCAQKDNISNRPRELDDWIAGIRAEKCSSQTEKKAPIAVKSNNTLTDYAQNRKHNTGVGYYDDDDDGLKCYI